MKFELFLTSRCRFEKNKHLPFSNGGDGTAGIGNFATEADKFWGKKDKLGKKPGKRGVSVADAHIPPAVTKVRLGEIDFGIVTLLPKSAKPNAIANVRPVLNRSLPFNPNLLTLPGEESTETIFKCQR